MKLSSSLLLICLYISTAFGATTTNTKNSDCNQFNTFFKTYGYDFNDFCCQDNSIKCDKSGYITDMYENIFYYQMNHLIFLYFIDIYFLFLIHIYIK